ncbi:MAG TPA: PRC-barrel domain-containing protein [Casimicrobiaceae bacterium]|jgi:sporulation protein YlmC with PRC-barrel domain
MATQANPYGSTAESRSGAKIIPSDNQDNSGPGPEVMDASTLQGDSVVNAAGESLGKVEAIMLDVTTGRIAYAVLSFGGFLGMGAKLFAIPWGALTLDAREHRFILDVSKEKLQNAEGFDKDRWPSMADSNWAAEIHSYYNITPYWEDDEREYRERRSTSDLAPGEPKVY